MALAAIQEAPPLITDDHGVVRVGGTRVTLDVVVHAYDAGASPEEIVQSFPTLKLPDVYATIAYLLRHRGEVDAYLAEQAAEAEAIRRTIEERYPTAVCSAFGLVKPEPDLPEVVRSPVSPHPEGLPRPLDRLTTKTLFGGQVGPAGFLLLQPGLHGPPALELEPRCLLVEPRQGLLDLLEQPS